MPARTNKQAAKRKSNPMPEMSPKRVTRTVDKKVKGLAYETRPVHNPNPADKRLPARETDYLHINQRRSQPSERELWARDAHKRGIRLDEILIGSGFTVENLMACLGIPRDGNEKLYEYLAECKQKHNSI